MAIEPSLDVRPVPTPHLGIDHLVLEDKDFKIKDSATPAHLLKLQFTLS